MLYFGILLIGKGREHFAEGRKNCKKRKEGKIVLNEGNEKEACTKGMESGKNVNEAYSKCYEILCVEAVAYQLGQSWFPLSHATYCKPLHA